jgi:hypothetical protein
MVFFYLCVCRIGSWFVKFFRVLFVVIRRGDFRHREGGSFLAYAGDGVSHTQPVNAAVRFHRGHHLFIVLIARPIALALQQTTEERSPAQRPLGSAGIASHTSIQSSVPTRFLRPVFFTRGSTPLASKLTLQLTPCVGRSAFFVPSAVTAVLIGGLPWE